MYKGIFWRALNREGEPVWICRKVLCDADGVPTEPFVDFSAKSGDNFNHKAELEKLSRSVTDGRPFDWFPRGRVEIKRGRVVIYAHPSLTADDCVGQTCGCRCARRRGRLVTLPCALGRLIVGHVNGSNDGKKISQTFSRT